MSKVKVDEDNITMSAIEMAREMSELPPLVFSRLQFAFYEKGDLSPPQIAVLIYLAEKDYRMSDLSKRMSVSMPAMTGIVSRLVQKELVKRGDDPSDRRVVTVGLTKRGKKITQEFFTAVENLWLTIIEDLSEKERIEFIKVIRKIKELLRKGMKS